MARRQLDSFGKRREVLAKNLVQRVQCVAITVPKGNVARAYKSVEATVEVIEEPVGAGADEVKQRPPRVKREEGGANANQPSKPCGHIVVERLLDARDECKELQREPL
ncbi:efflux RND transporter permease subunit [Babesia caballi]|uniref:Efflux RND transporter permease subunit n=1 Tax=Babesia caballi TaxID=5871 RepID=A0AAV4M062_BABCB|nr:efflux RND transporter permease subunit [Babesia caballi]